jgi:hypothetical protein
MTAPSLNGGQMFDRWNDLPRSAKAAWLAVALLFGLGCASPSVTTGAGPGSASTATTTPPACTAASPAAINAVTQGLTVTGGGLLVNAKTIEVLAAKRTTQGWPTQFVAATITGPGWRAAQRSGSGRPVPMAPGRSLPSIPLPESSLTGATQRSPGARPHRTATSSPATTRPTTQSSASRADDANGPRNGSSL